MRSSRTGIDVGTLPQIVSSVLAMPLAATLVALGIPALAMAQGTDAGGSAPQAPAMLVPTPGGDQKAATPKNASELSTLSVNADALTAISNPSSGSSIGFSKPILETPRSVSFLDQDQLNTLGISKVEDLTRAVPGTYTTTRYGLQGGINIRGVQADVYWRGMKRLTMQGHERTDLNGLDSLEVVEGPPSPIYGMGEMGGYANETPKSGRAVNGAYLSDVTGFTQGTVGSYQKAEAQIGVGGPLDVLGKQGGYYVFGLLEDSNTFVDQVKAKQKILQATNSVDNAIGPFRIESGVQYQNSQTSGAFVNRVTQDLISSNKYITGSPLVDLRVFNNPATNPNYTGQIYNPSNYNTIGYRQIHINSPLGSDSGTTAGTCASAATVASQAMTPIPGGMQQGGCAQPYSVTSLKLQDGSVAAGTATVNNQPLNQTFQWPVDPVTGKFLRPGQFPKVQGIPQSMYNYLVAHPEADPTGRLRAQGVGGPVPVSGWLPVGNVLDPRTTGYAHPNYHKDGSFERLQNAVLYLGYYDMIDDKDPNFTMKNQMLSDNVEATKDSYLPYGEYLTQHSLEDKFTATHTLPEEYLPSWLAVNTLGSLNYRVTHAVIKDAGGDFDWRQDMLATQGNDVQLANNNFANPLNNPTYATGALNTVDRTSWYNDFGAGLLFDVDIFKNTNVVFGGRWDGSSAHGGDARRFNETPNNPLVTSSTIASSDQPISAQFLNSGAAMGWSHGTSWSISLSQQLPFGLRPYATLAKSAIALEDSNNIMATSVITSTAGHIGASKLREAGIKGSWLDGTLTFTDSYFIQARTDISAPTDPTASANVSSTNTKGWENQIHWQVTRKLNVGAYSFWESSHYIYNSVSSITVSARLLGFQDVTDANGNVLYPAEAFDYGGKANINIPAPLASLYTKVVGVPDHQYGVNMNYIIGSGFSFHADGQYFQAVWADRINTVRLPSTTNVDAGLAYDRARYHFSLSGFNLLNRQYFRAGIGDTNATLVSAMPTRNFEFKAKIDF